MPNLTVDPQTQDNISSPLGLDPRRGSNPLKAVFIGILIFVLLSLTAYGAYWYTKNYLVVPSSQAGILYIPYESSQPKPSLSNLDNQTAPAAVDETAGWKTFQSLRCGFTIKVPQEFMIENTQLSEENNDPKMDYGCIVSGAPDYKVIGDSNPEGTWLQISRTVPGEKYLSVTINSIDDYVKAMNSVVRPGGAVSESAVKRYGNDEGIYYVLNAMDSTSNFVFMKNGYIFNIAWPHNNQSPYLRFVDQILSTFKFL